MNRRQFLGSLFAGTVALNTSTIAQALANAPRGAFSPLGQGGIDTRDPVIHLIRRMTFGVTPALVAHVRQIGIEAFIEEQLAPERLDDSALDPVLEETRDILNENGGVLLRELEARQEQVIAPLIGATTVRAISSQRQLYERMVGFWSDHFSMFIGKGIVLFLKVDDDRDVIRPKAMGRFRELLGASAHSPAMLFYLDNVQNEASAPNENYARELMELHTLGVNGGYSEDDVKEVARAFTGWSMTGRRENDDGRVMFQFRRLFHDNDAKIVLGTAIPADGGEQDGETVLDILANHPSTARLIATKLARRFVADQPSATIIDAAAAAFTASGGDIRAVLRVIFHSDEFWQAPPKFKQPFEHTVSLLRAMDYHVSDLNQLLRTLRAPLDSLGNIPFTWTTPDGFPDVMEAWKDGLLTRWNLALGAMYGGVRGAESNTDGLLEMLAVNGIAFETEPVLDFMAGYTIGRPLSADERTIMLDFAAASSTDPTEQILGGLALLLASPAFQYK